MYIVLILIIIVVVTIILDLKKGKGYEKKLTSTMKFVLAAGANTYQQAECSCIDIGGNPADKWAQKHMKRLLKTSWCIHNAEELNQAICWLFKEGHNVECLECVERYKTDPDSFKPKKLLKMNKDFVMETIKTISTKYPDQGIIAWDLCRVCNVAGWGFLAGYITYEQAIKYSVDACNILQQQFTSWDDMMENYFLGLGYWNEDVAETRNRKGWYEKSKKEKNSIYNVDWNTKLKYHDVISPRTK